MRRHMPRHLGALVLSVFCLMLAPAAEAQLAATKVAVVDIELVVAGSERGQQLQRELEVFRQGVQSELKAKADSVRALQQRMRDATTPADLQRLQKQYEDESIALKRLQDDKTREGQKLQDKGLEDIERSLGPVLTAIRDEEGYDLILARTPGIVLLVSDRVDITTQVIERFNNLE